MDETSTATAGVETPASTDTATTTSVETTVVPAQQPTVATPKADDPTTKSYTWDDLKELRQEAADNRKALNEFKEATQQRETEATTRAQNKVVRAELKAAAAEHNVGEKQMKAFHALFAEVRDQVTFDDDDDPVNLSELVAGLIEENDYLVGAAKAPVAKSTGSNAPRDKNSTKALYLDDIQKMDYESYIKLSEKELEAIDERGWRDKR